MIIEITGSLGSGKSELTVRLVRMFAEEGVDVRVVQVGGRPSADFFTIPWAPLFAVRHPALLRLLLCAATRDADSTRASLAQMWNILRKAGMSERLTWSGDEGLVIWDEGPIHMAHNAFAHIQQAPRRTEIIKFGELVPKPDLIVRVRAKSEVALSRVLARGHKRTRDDPSAIAALLANAEHTFSTLTEVEAIRCLTLEVNNDSSDLADLDRQSAAIVNSVLEGGWAGTR